MMIMILESLTLDVYRFDLFCLVPFFNGTSTLSGYLMPNTMVLFNA